MNEMNEKKKRLQQAEAGVDTVTLPAIRHQVKTPSFFQTSIITDTKRVSR